MSDLTDIYGEDIFPDPKRIGQSEYAAIHDCISDALEELDIHEKTPHTIAMLEEFISWATAIKRELKKVKV